jgi:uncharacterized protein (DUF952 family)
VGAPLYHLALAAEWERARAAGAYDRSTIGRSLAEEGFIHCSFASQVPATADRFYRGRDDVVLLRIDPDLLDADVRVEEVPGAGEAFPHLYGPLPVGAVAWARPVPLDGDGGLDLSGLLDG